MLKVFLVLYVGTGIGGTWQVNTYSGCASMAQKRQTTIDDVILRGRTQTGMRVTVAQRTALREWRFKCVVADKRPVIGETM